MLYEVAVVHTDEEGKETLVLAPTPVIASTEDVAKMIAGIKLAEAGLKFDPEDLNVMVRPFVE